MKKKGGKRSRTRVVPGVIFGLGAASAGCAPGGPGVADASGDMAVADFSMRYPIDVMVARDFITSAPPDLSTPDLADPPVDMPPFPIDVMVPRDMGIPKSDANPVVGGGGGDKGGSRR